MPDWIMYLAGGFIFGLFYVKRNTPDQYKQGHPVVKVIFYLICMVIWPVLLFIDIVIFVLKFLGRLSKQKT